MKFFADDGFGPPVQIGTTQNLSASGTASVTGDLGETRPGFAFGQYTITANYSGDSFYLPAVATMPERGGAHAGRIPGRGVLIRG